MRTSTLRQPRSGVALMWAVVVLAILGALSASIAWHFITVRRVLSDRQERTQTLWLARSGCELAVARLLADPDGYTGEIVELIPDSKVQITVEKDPTRPDTYRIRCEAHYPTVDPRAAGLTLTRIATRKTGAAGVRIELVESDLAPGTMGKGS